MHVIKKKIEFFFIIIMILLPFSYIARSLFRVNKFIVYGDKAYKYTSDAQFGDNYLLHFLNFAPMMLYLLGAYAYLFRCISYYSITSDESLILFSNTMRKKLPQIIIYLVIFTITISILLLKTFSESDLAVSLIRWYMWWGYIVVSITLSIVVTLYLRHLKIHFPIVYSLRRSTIVSFSVSFSIWLFLRGISVLGGVISRYFNIHNYLSYDNAFYSLGFFLVETFPTILIIGFLFKNLKLEYGNNKDQNEDSDR